jgi:hypothetical protein
MAAPLNEAAPVRNLGIADRMNNLTGVSRVAIPLFVLFTITGIAYAAYRVVSHEIPRGKTETRLNVHVYAPYGSLAIAPGASGGSIARLDMEADESGEDPAMYLRYGVSQVGVGNLRVSIGDDEGALQQHRPVAMWGARSQQLLVNTNYITSDNGAGYSYGYERNHQTFTPIPMRPGPRQQESAYKSRLYLATDLPTSLNAQLGFGQSYIDLSGIPLERAYIETGASKARVVFGSANPTPMSVYQISAGVGECALDGICNSNAAKFEFDGGIGYYSLAFGGELQRNMDATVSVGLGKVSINIPPQAGRVQVFYDDNLFSGYNFTGLAIRRSGYATSVGFDRSTAPILTLHLSSGMGKMNVVYR